MKANELRIGNLIKSETGQILPVEYIHKDTVGLRNEMGGTQKHQMSPIFSYDFKRLQRVKLTEEWLIKFGFNKPAHTWNCDIFHLTEWNRYPLNWCVAMDKNGAVIVERLKYVHQLQNLYFALTGTELKLSCE